MNKRSESKGRKLSGLIRALLTGIVTFLLLFAIILTGTSPDQYDIHVGQPASKTIYATKDVEDTVTTQALREAAANAVEPSYKSVDTSVNAVVTSKLHSAFNALAQLRADYAQSDAADDALLEKLNRAAPVELNADTAAALLNSEDESYTSAVQACISAVTDVLNSTLPEGQEGAAVTRISRNLLTSGYSSGLVSLCAEVVRGTIQPNMLIDTEITEDNRQKARDAVEPEILVKREAIVREGEIVTEAQYQMISSLGLIANDKLDIPLLGGLALLILILCAVIALFLQITNPKLLTDGKRLLLLCIIIVLELSISLLVRDIHSYLMPVALGVILISILINQKTALVIGCALSFLVSMLVSADGLFSSSMFTVMLMAFAAGPLAVLILSKHPLRTGTLLAGFVIGAANFVIAVSSGFISSVNLNVALKNALWAFGGGMFSAVLAIGLQSLLEWLFNLATNAKLIELSNPNQPLLRRLLLEAPGTYHHSIIVANLAEAGAAAIGGNGLLARVGAYYHDIGKLKRPMYFKENQMGDNPHDRTDPRVSAAILTAHTRDGMQMAQKERLPVQIQDIIRQHHGDQAALYFYDKASKLYGDDIDVNAFRYEGPRPRSKEAAVVMLADTIEAASRTLANPNPEKMEQLIRKLIREKMDDGQLNDSALTFSDLDTICSTFSTVLTGVFHERIEYPDIPMPPRKAESEAAAEPEQSAEEAEETPAEENGEAKSVAD